MKMKYLTLVIIVLSTCCTHLINGMSEKQLIAAMKLVRNVCQPKYKATDEDIVNMHQGIWDIDHSAKCYMFCVLNSYKLIDKDNTFNFDSAMAQIKQLPDKYKIPSEKCIEECKDSAATLSDKCEAAYEIAKCNYFCSPSDYYFP